MFVELNDPHTHSHIDFYYRYNQSETVDYVQESYTGILERNATYLGLKVHLYVHASVYEIGRIITINILTRELHVYI